MNNKHLFIYALGSLYRLNIKFGETSHSTTI